MKNRHAEILFPPAKNAWMDLLNSTSVACHKAERFGVFRGYYASDGIRGNSKEGKRDPDFSASQAKRASRRCKRQALQPIDEESRVPRERTFRRVRLPHSSAPSRARQNSRSRWKAPPKAKKKPAPSWKRRSTSTAPSWRAKLHGQSPVDENQSPLPRASWRA